MKTTPLLSINTNTTPVKASIIFPWTTRPPSPAHPHSLHSILHRAAIMVFVKEDIFAMSQPVNDLLVLSSLLEIKIQTLCVDYRTWSICPSRPPQALIICWLFPPLLNMVCHQFLSVPQTNKLFPSGKPSQMLVYEMFTPLCLLSKN